MNRGNGLAESDLQPAKIYLTGFNDQTTTADLISYLTTQFPSFSASKREIEWIDDSSANLIFPSPEDASQALTSLSADSERAADLGPLQSRRAKTIEPFQNDPLEIRMALTTDKKQPKAYEASRFYLLHPEHDPRENMNREFRNGRPRRGRGGHGEANGDYRRNRYDDREHGRRLRNTNGEVEEFNASMYDDEAQSDGGAHTNNRSRESDLFNDSPSRRRQRQRKRSASPHSNPNELDVDTVSEDETAFRKRRRTNGFRTRSPPSGRFKNTGKELFSSDTTTTTMLQASKELIPSSASTLLTSDPTSPPSSANNRVRAANLRKELFAAATTSASPGKELFSSSPKPSSKELFPHKTDRSNHRRTDGIDLDAPPSPEASLGDSFSSSLAVPLVDGAGDVRAGQGLRVKGSAALNRELMIKGSAAKTGIRIKGMGGVDKSDVKELFPNRYAATDDGRATGGNRGKELFDEVLEGRGKKGRGRVKAGDLFG